MGYKLGSPTVQQYFDANGDPLALGTIEFYIWNTGNPTAVYQDSTGTSAGTSVTLNSIGAPQNSGGTAIALFFDEEVTYKIVRKDAAGTAIGPTIGPYLVTEWIPLAGNPSGPPITGLLLHENDTVNKAFFVGISELLGIDDFVIASTGANQANANVYISVNSLAWTFSNTGETGLPDIDYTLVDPLSAVNRAYVDAAIGGGVPPNTYLELAGTNPSYPITGDVDIDISGTDYSFDSTAFTAPTIHFAPPSSPANYFSMYAGTGFGGYALTIEPTANLSGINIISRSAGGTDYVLALGVTGDLGWQGQVIADASGPYAVRLSGNQTGIAGNKTWTGVHTFSASPTFTLGGRFKTTTAVPAGASAIFNDTISVQSPPILTGSNAIISLGYLAYETCDIRLKENIAPLEYGLAEVLEADTISFVWKDTEKSKMMAGQRGVGFSAQQMQTLIPEAIQYDEEKDQYGISSTPLIVTLFSAVKELSAQLDEAKARLDEAGL